MRREVFLVSLMALIFALQGADASSGDSSFVSHDMAMPDNAGSIDFGVVRDESVRLIKPISAGNEVYYILNTASTDTVGGTSRRALGRVFGRVRGTDEMHRSVIVKGYKITLLNTPELIIFRKVLGYRAPQNWHMSAANLASATAVSDTDHHNVSLTTEEIFTDGGGIYDGVAIVKIQRTNAPSTSAYSAHPTLEIDGFEIAPARNSPTKSVSTPHRKPFDPNDPLDCNVNVNCTVKDDVVSKMRARWVKYSSKTVFSNECLAAISRVEGWQIWVRWSNEQRIGVSQPQMSVCNAK